MCFCWKGKSCHFFLKNWLVLSCFWGWSSGFLFYFINTGAIIKLISYFSSSFIKSLPPNFSFVYAMQARRSSWTIWAVWTAQGHLLAPRLLYWVSKACHHVLADMVCESCKPFVCVLSFYSARFRLTFTYWFLSNCLSSCCLNWMWWWGPPLFF